MRDTKELLQALNSSAFRRRFHLASADQEYLRRKGLAAVIGHAHEFVAKKLAPAEPRNDGKQTPWKGHPVFVAQHATATCCRGCLAKWHRIEKGRQLTAQESEYVVGILELGLRMELARMGTDRVEGTRDLFGKPNIYEK